MTPCSWTPARSEPSQRILRSPKWPRVISGSRVAAKQAAGSTCRRSPITSCENHKHEISGPGGDGIPIREIVIERQTAPDGGCLNSIASRVTGSRCACTTANCGPRTGGGVTDAPGPLRIAQPARTRDHGVGGLRTVEYTNRRPARYQRDHREGAPGTKSAHSRPVIAQSTRKL